MAGGLSASKPISRPHPNAGIPAGRRFVVASVRFVDDHRTGVVAIEQVVDAGVGVQFPDAAALDVAAARGHPGIGPDGWWTDTEIGLPEFRLRTLTRNHTGISASISLSLSTSCPLLRWILLNTERQLLRAALPVLVRQRGAPTAGSRSQDSFAKPFVDEATELRKLYEALRTVD